MKRFVFLLVFLLSVKVSVRAANIPDLTEIRSLYDQSASSKTAARQLLEMLTKLDLQSDPLMVCYKGAAEMIQAKYAFSPISKLSSFRKGKLLIENAIARDRDGIEMRYLRFTIQTNLPGFLGYSGEIENDKQFLLKKLDVVNDKVLKNNIITYLSASKYCTEAERKKLIK
ncbi:MAG: hypothetical protein V4594_04295 [Bacteroidota bacterium]